MCFSATASFTASALLLLLGRLAWRQALPKDRPIAAIPLLFGAQQAAEGVVWLARGTNHPLLSIGAYGFLVIAFIVWPLYVPWALRASDPSGRHEVGYTITGIIGIAVALVLGYFLLTAPLVLHNSTCASIRYSLTLPFWWKGWYEMVILGAYASATIVPWFFSSKSAYRVLGFVLAISCILSWIAWHDAFTSVWCFFAALLSSGILYAVRRPQHRLVFKKEASLCYL